MPMRQWIVGPLREFTDAKLTALRGAGVFRREAIETARGSLHDLEMDWNGAYHLWQLVSTQSWIEAFFGADPKQGNKE